MPYASPGSVFQKLGGVSEKVPGRTFLVIKSLDSIEIKNIEDLVSAIKKIGNKRHLSLSFKDNYYIAPEQFNDISIDVNSNKRSCLLNKI